MSNILLLVPLEGNGGIASWTKKFISTFQTEEFKLFPLNISPKRNVNLNLFQRIYSGINALNRISNELSIIIENYNFEIMHITTSGSIGTFRDYKVAQLCKYKNIKTIMHCRYGCIPEDINSKGILGFLLRKTMSLYDQIWVLDQRSFNALNTFDFLKDKVFLTPNSIDVAEVVDTTPKNYKNIAFIANLIPTKGLYELVRAVKLCDNIHLDIIGPGTDKVINNIKKISEFKFGKDIIVHGKLSNKDALNFMRKVDVIALPTYYRSEAFPISILEAMSLSKLVISTYRAAIPDILTSLDGSKCGILVNEKSVTDIIEAIKFCKENSIEADLICQKAYEKVFHYYRTEVVYEIYKDNYRKLLPNK